MRETLLENVISNAHIRRAVTSGCARHINYSTTKNKWDF